jgi:ribosomal protein S30
MSESGGAGKKGGKGTHGSLTKAGKVRHNFPKNWETARKADKYIKKKDGVKTKVQVIRWHKKKHLGPRIRNKRLAYMRGEEKFGGLGRAVGQQHV